MTALSLEGGAADLLAVEGFEGSWVSTGTSGTPAHSSRITHDKELTDFYDAFSLFSYAHRRLDSMKRLTPRGDN